MQISILTVFPDLYKPFLETSLVHRAQQNKIVSIQVNSFFDYVAPKERIDAPIFGHGSGMLIRPQVVEKAIFDQELQRGIAYRIFFSPHGTRLTQPVLRDIISNAQKTNHVMLIPARYEGMDARVEQKYADIIISVGDFVLMGGDLPAMMVLEGMLRLLPGIVGKESSVSEDSFTGPFVDYPSYTEPVTWQGMQVPDVVRSGNHATLYAWRMQEAARRTVRHHFAWLRSNWMTSQELVIARRQIPNHYIVLMHSDVLIGNDRKEGLTSVTSIDIHDIARSSMTYGIMNFFLVTPLLDQQNMVQTLLDFWLEGAGTTYNYNRHSALKTVRLCNTLQEVVQAIELQEDKKPLLIATSARSTGIEKLISFSDQEQAWSYDRPILLIFGTGKGLTETLLQSVDFVLLPIHGFSEFNHLSVRSAIAIALDRWLGISEQNIVKKVAE